MGNCGEFMYICTFFNEKAQKERENHCYFIELDCKMRFIGDYSAKADAKGRVFLPVAFRKILDAEGEQGLVLRKDVFQKCLVLYPESVWNAQLDGLRGGLNQWNSKDQMMLRQFVVDAELVELDNQGRLLISKNKLQYAGIEGDVRFLAMVDRIEVWSKQMFEALMEQCDALGGEMEQKFGEKDGLF